MGGPKPREREFITGRSVIRQVLTRHFFSPTRGCVCQVVLWRVVSLVVFLSWCCPVAAVACESWCWCAVASAVVALGVCWSGVGWVVGEFGVEADWFDVVELVVHWVGSG